MNGRILAGKIDIRQSATREPVPYERFTVTINPDKSKTLRTLTRSPAGDLLRDVNVMVAANWRDVEAIGRVFYKGELQGTVLRRVVGDRVYSYVWRPDSEMDEAQFHAPPGMMLGYHPILLDAWKMNFINTTNRDYQDIVVLTVSNTWNGRSLGHGEVVRSTAKFDGREWLELPAGTFECEKFVWLTPFQKELHVWRTGDAHLLARLFVASGDNQGTTYELAQLEVESLDD
jgi:hypothetical protein